MYSDQTALLWRWMRAIWVGLFLASAARAAAPKAPHAPPAAGSTVVAAPAGGEVSKAAIYRPGSAAVAPGGPAVRLGLGPHLLVDDFLIQRSTKLRRRVNVPARDPKIPNPIITGKGDRNFQPYVTVLRDPATGRFRIWYGAATERQDMGASHIGYKESADGMRWPGPPRILADPAPIQFGDSVLDEGPDFPRPQERYKLGWWKDGGLKIAVSADGLAWKPLRPHVVLRHNHDINNLFRDTLRDRYVATISVFTAGPMWKGGRRVTMQSVSRNLLDWQKPWYVLTPDDRVDQGQTQFYAMNGHLIRGDLWIALVKVLRDDLQALGTPRGAFGVGYTTLAWTRDGEHWLRDVEPFFSPDPRPDAWDHAHAWLDYQLPVGDEVFLYYGGYKSGHKMNRFEERQIGLVRMPRDRYVSRDAGAEEGLLLTRPLVLAGSKLTLNAKVEGHLRVRLLDGAGKPLPGFDAADAQPIRGDGLALPVRWKGSLATLRGKPVQIEFALRNAQLYGFDLRE